MSETIATQSGKVTCYLDGVDGRPARACEFAEALAALNQPDARVWINFLAPDQEQLSGIIERLGIHELAVEDLFSPQSRAKVEESPHNLFCIVHALNLNTADDLFDVVNLNAFLGSNYLITTQRATLPAVARVQHWLERGGEALRRGPDFVLYEIIDIIVDEYLTLSDQMSDEIDSLEELIFGKPNPGIPEKIFGLKHRAAWMRRSICPYREILNSLTNRPHEFVKRETQIYLRDVYDHVYRISENVDTFRDLLQGAMDAYLTLVANRTNEVMKVLSVVATIILPINMLTSLYGTNFARLPGADHPYGFWIFCFLLLSTAITVTLLFRLRKWL